MRSRTTFAPNGTGLIVTFVLLNTKFTSLSSAYKPSDNNKSSPSWSERNDANRVRHGCSGVNPHLSRSWPWRGWA